MRKRIVALVTAIMMALMMSFGGAAFAKITPEDVSCTDAGNGEPEPVGRGPSRAEPVKGSFSRLGLIPGALAFLLALIHPSAWNRNSRKFGAPLVFWHTLCLDAHTSL